LLPLLEQYAQHIICFGDSGKDIYQQLSNDQVSLHRSPNLAQAVRRAAALAGPDACVLLSPACASFDEFDDFEHRGRVFKQLIQDMKELS
jgi:UDP-N-acetylmuramoylalanine--D-glutamate ligase